MGRLIGIILITCMCMTPFYAAAGDFDGSKPLMCVVKDSMECTRETGCEEVDEKDINMSAVLKVDFDEKKIRLISSDTGERVSEIENRKQIDGKLIVQGAEDGYKEYQDGNGWSMSIMESNGDMVLSASGDNVAFVLFGECVPASYMN